MSLIRSAQLDDLDPYAYMKDAVTDPSREQHRRIAAASLDTRRCNSLTAVASNVKMPSLGAYGEGFSR